jgi:cobalt-zinc-cadmium efflux system membrane fusion protein
MNHAKLLTVGIAAFVLQCGKSDAPVAVDQNADRTVAIVKDDVVTLPEESQQIIGITVQDAETRECRHVLGAMGRVLAPTPQTVIVSYAFLARVSDIHVSLGEWVEADEPVVTLDGHDVGEAESEYYKAVANCELAKVNLERQRRLLEEGIGAKKNLLAAEAEHLVAETSCEAAEKRLHVLGFTEADVQEIHNTHLISPTITLDAPITGKVVEIEAIRGAMVDESTKIMTIIDTRTLWVDAEIYERDICGIAMGQPVEITVPAYPDETFTGTVVYVGDVVREETRTITVRAEFANKGERLKPGMFAKVCIVLDQGTESVVVPVAAVLEEGNRQFVFVKQSGNFERREVTAGPVEGADQQIVSGLRDGESVVVQGNYQLRSELKRHLLQEAHHAHPHGEIHGEPAH